MSPTDTILVWRIGNIGDIVVSVPAFRALRRHFKDKKLVLMTGPGRKGLPCARDVIGPAGIFDEIIEYLPEELRRPSSLIRLLGRIRSLGPDLLVHLDLLGAHRLRNFRDSTFFRLAGCRRLVGFYPQGLVPALRRRVAQTGIYPKETDRLMAIVAEAGVTDLSVDFDLGLTPEECARVDSIWQKAIGDHKGPVVAVCPGAKFPVKRWPVERFATVAKELVRRTGAFVLLFGGKEDAEAAGAIAREAGRATNLAGKTTVRETYGLQRQCALYLGNDSGAMHLAAAARVKCVAIFTARDRPESWYPYGDGHKVFIRNMSCGGCRKEVCETMECILSVTAREVLDSCLELLEGRAEERPCAAGSGRRNE